MNNKQPGFPLHLRSVGMTNLESKVKANSKNLPDSFKANRQVSESQQLKELQELKARNHDLEKALEKGKKELADLKAVHAKSISIIAHDLRSPFHSILGALEIVKNELSKHHLIEIEEYIDLASASTHKTLNLLEVLLTWSISQRNGLTLKPDKINLSELIHGEIKIIETLLNIKKISMDYSASTNVQLIADLQMVKIIIRNLINNAIKYTSLGGEIKISATENTSDVEIEVNDNGIGISTNDQRNLFMTDILQSTPGTMHETGTGLGLSMCKELVEMHGGKIWVESTPGYGSKFKFSIPQSHPKNDLRAE